MAQNNSAVTRFVVLAVPRTGSNYLVSLLHSHPDILCHTELFNKDKIWQQIGLGRENIDFGTKEARDRDPKAFMERIWSQPNGRSAVGFKFLGGQGRNVEKVILRDRSIRKIVLDRQNEVKTYVSLLTAKQSQDWGFVGTGEPPKRQPVTVNVEGLKQAADFNAAYYKRVRRALRWRRQSFMDISYEQLFDEATIRRLLSFLDISGDSIDQLESQFKKQSRGGLRERIANYDELETSLQGTRFLAQLKEDEKATA